MEPNETEPTCFVPEREVDDKGRIVDINEMTLEEKLDEILKTIRVFTDHAEKAMNDLPNNPLFKMLGKFL